MDERLVLERLLRVDDDRQRVVLDDDVLGRVHDRVPVAADDHGDRVADVVDRALGERPVRGRVDGHAGRRPGLRQRGPEVEVLPV